MLERVLSDEEKFRKAEEIYNRRKNINVTVPSRNLNRNTTKKDLKRLKKMLIQIAVCICIYFSVYFIQYSNYVFSNDVIKKVEEILAYDINFNERFSEFNEYMKNNKFLSGLFTFFNDEESNDAKNSQNVTDNTLIENNLLNDNLVSNELPENANQDNPLSTSNFSLAEENNSGANFSEENNQNTSDENVPEESNADNASLGIGGGESNNISSDDEQMNNDAQAIKDNYQITLPLRGTITSRFGERDIAPKFHTGIDIARNEGSEVISAINGTVILAEEQASYGKVIKIQNGDLVTLYAHCSEILVNVGDQINMMQNIAKVGSTGNSTGPHLHFEIIYSGRYVNPEYVMEFKE